MALALAQTDSHYWPAIKPVYDFLRETDTLSFEAWVSFMSAFSGHIMPSTFKISAYELPGRPLPGLESIGTRLSALTFDTLTYLHFSTEAIKLLSLNRDILKFTNLSVLVLEQAHDSDELLWNTYGGDSGERPVSTDRLFHFWSRAVHEAHAFFKLKVLVLRGFVVRPEHLAGPLAFPALALCSTNSVCLLRSLRTSKRNGDVYDDGIWRCLHIDSDDGHNSAVALGHDLDYEFKREDLTKHQKMQILYDFAISRAPTDRVADKPVISIAHGNPKLYNPEFTKDCVWFTRVGWESAPNIHDQKSVIDKNKDEASRDGSNKRRKMRGGKQQDIGSLLESFSA
ncbi:hypothetical protein BU24DRAFT_461361 [Aaosphaeria arxii CBS 175.79]|uniref:Uncharacterized protein n=1 Tax=Aaosphaeria arxii CBS 175.79 TaxID=1450172 RepID=A0A6A5XZ07_9PLEO|nr:uncharacterized protein BU24DRAFT_461361 [Aaosphaeria arxii CBS 175.79]KAF2018422.1 hypothetical protein BU24DRAFT_461361 [Aaosphaeria arxii CBS 175.79]